MSARAEARWDPWSGLVRLALFVAALTGLSGCGQDAPSPPSARTLAWREHVTPFLIANCVDCHGGEEPDGSLTLEAWASSAQAPSPGDMRSAGETWERMAEHVRGGFMPPEEAGRPPQEARTAFVDWITQDLETAWRSAPPAPGRVTLRRLSRYEYSNTIRDLLGIEVDATAFPADDVGYGFDHIGDVLSMPPMLFEKYLDAAERIADGVMNPDLAQRLEAEAQSPGPGGRVAGGSYFLFSNGQIGGALRVVESGAYTFRVRAWAEQAGPEAAKMEMRVDDRGVKTVRVPVTAKDAAVYETIVRLEPGRHTLAAAFVNDYYRPKDPDPTQRDRNLMVDWLVLSGLAQDQARAHGDGPGDHARCVAVYLTGAHPVKTKGANIRVGVSVDQVGARKISHLTRFGSLELGIERGRQNGNCRQRREGPRIGRLRLRRPEAGRDRRCPGRGHRGHRRPAGDSRR